VSATTPAYEHRIIDEYAWVNMRDDGASLDADGGWSLTDRVKVERRWGVRL
jgi:hypothetical protein